MSLPHPPRPSFSQVVSLLRFPLILLVVSIHALNPQQVLPELNASNYIYIYIYINEAIGHSLARIAVPLFFVFAGYYTFYRKDWSRPALWLSEWKKKGKNLLLPYLLWNTLYLLLLWGKTALPEALGHSPEDPFRITGLGQLISFYGMDVLDYPLWFVRDLLVLTLLAPLSYGLVSKLRGWLLLPLLLLYFLGWGLPLAGFSGYSLFWFHLGAVGGYLGLDPLPALRRARPWLIPLASLALLGLPYFSHSPYHAQLEAFTLLLGSALAVTLGEMCLERLPQLSTKLLWAERYVFFIYAAHAVLLINWARGLVYRVPFLRGEGLPEVLTYFFIWALTLLLCLGLYHLLQRWCPRALKILCGGR